LKARCPSTCRSHTFAGAMASVICGSLWGQLIAQLSKTFQIQECVEGSHWVRYFESSMFSFPPTAEKSRHEANTSDLCQVSHIKWIARVNGVWCDPQCTITLIFIYLPRRITAVSYPMWAGWKMCRTSMGTYCMNG
jgi:hypothetical protein